MWHRLSESYFRIRNWEPAIYRVLSIARFKQWLLARFGDDLAIRMGWHPIRFRHDSVASALSGLHRQTRKNEFVHLVVLLVMTAFSASLSLNGQVLQALVVMAINLPANFYPIALQRWTRWRIQRLVDRFSIVLRDVRTVG